MSVLCIYCYALLLSYTTPEYYFSLSLSLSLFTNSWCKLQVITTAAVAVAASTGAITAAQMAQSKILTPAPAFAPGYCPAEDRVEAMAGIRFSFSFAGNQSAENDLS